MRIALQVPLEVAKPLEAIPPQEGNLPGTFGLVELDQRNVVIESMKEAEADNAMILRLYEAMHQRCKVAMKLNLM